MSTMDCLSFWLNTNRVVHLRVLKEIPLICCSKTKGISDTAGFRNIQSNDVTRSQVMVIG